jgi:DNA-binding CsgD family transcriptional regulator
MSAALEDPVWSENPRRFPTVRDCTMPPGDAPCVRTECRYHLAHRRLGDHRLKPTRDCALAVANEGPRSLEEVAEILGMSRERVRQLEEQALEKLKGNRELRRLYDESE